MSCPARKNFFRTVRLWGIVLGANMTGCLLAAALLVFAHIVPAPHLESILTISRHYGSATATQHLAWGMPAGFLIASIVWILPRMDTKAILPAFLGNALGGTGMFAVLTYAQVREEV